jgi:hypothetical protein
MRQARSGEPRLAEGRRQDDRVSSCGYDVTDDQSPAQQGAARHRRHRSRLRSGARRAGDRNTTTRCRTRWTRSPRGACSPSETSRWIDHRSVTLHQLIHHPLGLNRGGASARRPVFLLASHGSPGTAIPPGAGCSRTDGEHWWHRSLGHTRGELSPATTSTTSCVPRVRAGPHRAGARRRRP